MLRQEVERGEQEVVPLTQAQMGVLDMLRGQRRAWIVGPQGSGKTMLAREKARRLAREGFSTLPKSWRGQAGFDRRASSRGW